MNEIVFIENEQIVTSSKNIARDFNKEHHNVIKAIEGIVKNHDTHDMFYEIYYTHPQNKQVYRKFLMNRDGFTLLVMGFTGKKAMEFKLRYIDEFNKMERELQELSTPSYMLDDPVKRAERWIEEQKEKKLLEESNIKKDQLIGELKPKADYTDVILKNKSLITITQIAKDYGMSGQAMNQTLNRLGIQYKQSDQWLLYAKYHDKGYTHSEPIDIKRSNGTMDVKLNTKWTQKGRLFLYNILKENDIIPTIEKELIK